MEKKFDVNLDLYEPGPSGYRHARKSRGNQRQKLQLLVSPGTCRKLDEVIKNFEVIISSALLPKVFVCDVTEKCAYTTDRLTNLNRHKAICKDFNTKKIIFKEKVIVKDKVLIDLLNSNNFGSSFIAKGFCQSFY